jgi:hypothetical protein
MRRRISTCAFFLCATLSSWACHEATMPNTVCPGCDLPPLADLQVSPAAATINVGQTIQMTDTVVSDAGRGPHAASWSSSDSVDATVDSTGLVRGKAASSGVAICAAVSISGYSAHSCATITVQVAPPGETSASSRRTQSRLQGRAP